MGDGVRRIDVKPTQSLETTTGSSPAGSLQELPPYGQQFGAMPAASAAPMCLPPYMNQQFGLMQAAPVGPPWQQFGPMQAAPVFLPYSYNLFGAMQAALVGYNQQCRAMQAASVGYYQQFRAMQAASVGGYFNPNLASVVTNNTFIQQGFVGSSSFCFSGLPLVPF